MYRFNNENIITGYIKQLLHTFELPCCRVFKTEEDCLSFLSGTTTNVTNNLYFIIRNFRDKGCSIVRLNITTSGKEFTYVDRYILGLRYNNLTKTFALDNNIYTTKVHKYLGEYLRFVRDFLDINLMPLYNCYANEMLETGNYKFVSIPVKYSNTYTLSLKVNSLKYMITSLTKNQDIVNSFEQNADKLTSTNGVFTITVDKPGSINAVASEKVLKLIIRVPRIVSTPLACLEGDYSKCNPDFAFVQANYEHEYTNEEVNKYISSISLLRKPKSDSSIDTPFADRLVEYLLGNVITNDDQISKNILDAKRKLYIRYCGKDPNTLNNLRANLNANDRLKLLDAVNKATAVTKNTDDMLFYIDKDVEAVLNDERRD